MTDHSHTRPNDLALASLILGILSLTGCSILTGIPAIITGVLGLKTAEGKGMSIAGIIMGSISVLFAVIVVVLLFLLVFIGALSSAHDSDNSGNQPMSPNSSLHQRT